MIMIYMYVANIIQYSLGASSSILQKSYPLLAEFFLVQISQLYFAKPANNAFSYRGIRRNEIQA